MTIGMMTTMTMTTMTIGMTTTMMIGEMITMIMMMGMIGGKITKGAEWCPETFSTKQITHLEIVGLSFDPCPFCGKTPTVQAHQASEQGCCLKLQTAPLQ